MADHATHTRGNRKERKGVVVSRSGDKTVKVRVSRRFRHPVYSKVMTETKNYHAHDEKNEAKVGDQVRIVETRPMSALKRWRVVEVMASVGQRGQDEQ